MVVAVVGEMVAVGSKNDGVKLEMTHGEVSAKIALGFPEALPSAATTHGRTRLPSFRMATVVVVTHSA